MILTYIFSNILLQFTRYFTSLPHPTFETLQSELRKGNIHDVIGWCIWIYRCQYRCGYLKTTVNPAVLCKNIETAAYIFNLIKLLPVTADDKNLIVIACSLWESLNQGQRFWSNISYSKRDRLRMELRDFIIARTMKYEALSAQIPMRILARLECRPANDIAVMDDVKRVLQRTVLCEAKNVKTDFCHEYDVVTVADFIKDLNAYYGDIFLCGDTLLHMMSSCFLYAEERFIELGKFEKHLPEYRFQLPKNWVLDEVNSCAGVTCYLHSTGLVVKLWLHKRETNNIVRCNESLCWTYSHVELTNVVVFGQNFLRPLKNYVFEEFGTVNILDRFFLRSALESNNVSLRSDNPQTFGFLVEMLVSSLLTSNRNLARITIDLLRTVYNLDYSHFMPVANIKLAAISLNSSSATKISQNTIVKGRHLIKDAIKFRLEHFSAKNTILDVEAAKQALLDVKALLNEYEVPFFLIGGTLLGAIREGSILSADYDIDIGIFQTDLDSLGVYNIFRDITSFKVIDVIEEYLVKVRHSSGVEVDVFIHDYVDGRLRHRGRVHEWYNDNFVLDELELFDEKFSIPADYERWLDENYGHWMHPVLFYNVSYDTPNRKYVTDTSDGVYHLVAQIQKSIRSRNKSNYILASNSLLREFGIDINLLLIAAEHSKRY